MTQPRPILAFLAALAAALTLTACGGDDDPPGENQAGIQESSENEKRRITIGSKSSSEQELLAEIYAEALRAAGYKVDTRGDLGSERSARRSLESGEIDAYPEYTGTALLSFFDATSAEIPKDPQKAYEQVRDRLLEERITALPPTPFTSSKAVARARRRTAALEGPTPSDLKDKPFNATLLVRSRTMSTAGPDLAAAVVRTSRGLTDRRMRKLIARVDVDGRTPRQVAREYLRQAGLVE